MHIAYQINQCHKHIDCYSLLHHCRVQSSHHWVCWISLGCILEGVIEKRKGSHLISSSLLLSHISSTYQHLKNCAFQGETVALKLHLNFLYSLHFLILCRKVPLSNGLSFTDNIQWNRCCTSCKLVTLVLLPFPFDLNLGLKIYWFQSPGLSIVLKSDSPSFLSSGVQVSRIDCMYLCNFLFLILIWTTR